MIRKILVDIPPIVPFFDKSLQVTALLTVATISLAAHGKFSGF